MISWPTYCRVGKSVIGGWHDGEMNVEALLYAIAAGQGGVVRREQALQRGMTRHQIDSRVKSGKWTSVASGGYRLISMEGPLEIVRAAVAVLPSAVASHFSAARIHRMQFVPVDSASVTVHARTTHCFPDAQVFRSLDIRDHHIEDWHGLPVTTVERTVVGLSAVVSQRHLATIVDDLLANRRTTVDELDTLLREVARRGRIGVRAMRAILESRSGTDQQRTMLERGGLRILRGGGFPSFEVEYPIPWDQDRRYDVAFVESQLAVEWDSFRWHSQERMFQSDRERDRDALEHGWRILRFTWRDVTVSPEAVDQSVRALLLSLANRSAG
jgi:hypothetical protein